eukprot:TRINITY_DN11700_c0_g1_i1.p1 TRINITY_DN11700_c0_g1~~TRINITY_DN11700_c0_g1_i1.p1  ORF type:complete len:160 (-),score=33.05 TRINITY_DN11700_c0_g1_i1:46-525(-)
MGEQKDDRILFYSTKGEFGCFSNFSAHRLFLKGVHWPTSEHYFQAQKHAGTPVEEEIRKTDSPARAAKKGRSREHPIRPDWDKIKDQIMFEAVLSKFQQNQSIKEILLGTEDRELVEHTEKDSYWGDGLGGGRNQLGITLMNVREEIRRQEREEAMKSI